MPELAPIETRPPQGSCPSAEDLACYIDGTLPPEEAARVTEHLASCESCFEVYSEVLQFQLKSEPIAETENVVPFPTSEWKTASNWVASSLAALLLIGLGFGAYSYLLAPPAPLVTADLVTPVQGPRPQSHPQLPRGGGGDSSPSRPSRRSNGDPVLRELRGTFVEHRRLDGLGGGKKGLAESLWLGEAKRGLGDSEPGQGLPPDKAAFRTGVQLVNLQVSLRANDGTTTVDYVIPALLGALQDQLEIKKLQDSYAEITLDIEKGKASRDLLPKASKLAQESRDYLDTLYLDLGQWVEAGRLAAIFHDPTFFSLPETRSFLRHVLWRDRLGFKDFKQLKGREELSAIDKALDKSELQPAGYTELREHFDNILKANYLD